MEFGGFFCFFLSLLSTNTPGLSLTPSPPAPTVCLSVHLSISFPHFLFHSPCQSLSKSPSVHVCLSVSDSSSLASTLSAHWISLQISSVNHSFPPFPRRLLRRPPSILAHLVVSQHWWTAGVSRFTRGSDPCWQSRRAATDRWQSPSGPLTVIQG